MVCSGTIVFIKAPAKTLLISDRKIHSNLVQKGTHGATGPSDCKASGLAIHAFRVISVQVPKAVRWASQEYSLSQQDNCSPPKTGSTVDPMIESRNAG